MRSHETPDIDTVSLEVPSLGTVRGLSFNNSTCQYLGIPYAEIPGRFQRSVPAGPWKDGIWDGRKLGPYCPQPPRDFYPVPSPARPWLETPPTDEFNCLNLNISVPKTPSSGNGDEPPLPVMIFLHGGAFTYSTGSSPIYDGRILAANSASTYCRPTIVITLNYRLGVYGFLGGYDLRDHNVSLGDGSVGGNLGLWDQVLALRWIMKHISAFGGDAKRITLFGQSAGGISVNAHLLRGEPLFSSAILQSGLLRLCGVMSLGEHQAVYQRLLSHLGVSLDLEPAERFRRLLDVSEPDLTAAMVPVFVVPVITMPLCDDGFFLPSGMPSVGEFRTLKPTNWCPRVMLGDARHECIIWNKSWDNMAPEPMQPCADLSSPTADLVIARIKEVLGEEISGTMTNLYGISKDSSKEDTFKALERMTTHGMYSANIYLNARTMAETTDSTTDLWAYHFDVPSPFDNAWNGLAHHSFDNVLIWGILRHLLPAAHQRVGDRMQEAWVRFAGGEEPWERLNTRGRWMVFGLDGSRMLAEEEDNERGYEVWRELDRQGLVSTLAALSDELCLRRQEVLQVL